MIAETRVLFATQIANECMKNPEMTNCFICSVAETVNIADLQIIKKMFYEAVEVAKKQKEQNQMN